jgi:hypothetical protein
LNIREVENVLDVYSLEEILELNDLTEVDVLYFLVSEQFVTLPEPLPLGVE